MKRDLLERLAALNAKMDRILNDIIASMDQGIRSRDLAAKYLALVPKRRALEDQIAAKRRKRDKQIAAQRRKTIKRVK